MHYGYSAQLQFAALLRSFSGAEGQENIPDDPEPPTNIYLRTMDIKSYARTLVQRITSLRQVDIVFTDGQQPGMLWKPIRPADGPVYVEAVSQDVRIHVLKASPFGE